MGSAGELLSGKRGFDDGRECGRLDVNRGCYLEERRPVSQTEGALFADHLRNSTQTGQPHRAQVTLTSLFISFPLQFLGKVKKRMKKFEHQKIQNFQSFEGIISHLKVPESLKNSLKTVDRDRNRPNFTTRASRKI